MQRASHQARKLDGADFLKTFKDSLRVDPPWDGIVDFATHPSFCGKKLFPRQLTLLKLAYLELESLTDYDMSVIGEWREGFWKNDPEGVQPDIFDRIAFLRERGYRWFPHIQMVMGRRASKGILGGVIGAHQIAYMHSLDNWQDHFGLDPNAKAYAVVIAVNQTQAARTLFNDLQGTVTGCKYLAESISTPKADHLTLHSPGDIRRIADMKARGIPIEQEIASLQALAASSNSASIRGNNMFFVAFDEMAFMLSGTGGVRTSEELYHALKPSLAQFKKSQMIYVPSSPYSQVGIFYDLYVEGRAQIRIGDEIKTITPGDIDADPETEVKKNLTDPRKLVVQLPSWALYKDWDIADKLVVTPKNKSYFFPSFAEPVIMPPEDDEAVRQEEESNPEKFRVERRGQFATTMDAYLREAAVDRMFEPQDWLADLAPRDYGMLNRQYRIHVDPSRVNANFALAIGHLEEAPPDEYGNVWPHVVFDLLKVWKPEEFPQHMIDYTMINEELDHILTKFPSTTEMSFDQYNSAGAISFLNHKHGPRIRIHEVTFTKQYNQDRFERFKVALNLGWVHAYQDGYYDGKSLLEHELKFLQEKNGKVDKQEIGPVTTKDLSDCAMVVATDLLREALDRWQLSIMGNVSFGSSDVGALRSVTGRELDRLGGGVGHQSPRSATPGSMRDKLNKQSRDKRSIRRASGATSITRGRRP